MIQNKLNFFFKHQIWHLGGIIVLFYIGVQLVDLDINTNTFLEIIKIKKIITYPLNPIVLLIDCQHSSDLQHIHT